jgi:hypothetical protein
MSFIRITSLISTYLVLLALIILFGGMSLAVVTRTAVMTHVFASSLFLLALSVPATLLCLFACYKRRIITAGNLIFSLFFSIVTFGLFYIGVVFTLRRDVKGHLNSIQMQNNSISNNSLKSDAPSGSA